MRSLFTSGVLDILLENNIEFPYVIGVSAGALTGVNYISKDIGRTARINIGFADDSRFIGMGNLLKKKSLFDFDFLFSRTQKIVPMDYKTFYDSKQRFIAVATDCATGNALYFEKGKTENIMTAIRASSSMPLLAPTVNIDGFNCLDGGVADAIPFKRAFRDGCSKPVLVLTRDKNFRATIPSAIRSIAMEKTFRHFSKFAQKMSKMPAEYNRTLDEISELEQQQKIFVIRPSKPVTVSRAERDPEKLEQLYVEGRAAMQNQLEALKAYLNLST